MDKQRRYEVRDIAERLDIIVSELNDLIDEEESVFNSRPTAPQWSVSGQDSKAAHEQMRSAADAISAEIEKLFGIAEARPQS